MRILAIAAATGLVLVAACDTQTDPAAPPTTQDALTTSTATPSPSPDEVAVTTDSVPATAEPTTQTTAAEDGPPEMPAEAKEQTDEGAEAFALHYIDLLNYTGRHPQVGLLEPLSADGCSSCANYEDSVAYNVEHGHYLLEDTFEVGEPSTVFTGEGARASIPVQQIAQPFFSSGIEIDREVPSGEANLIVRVTWGSGWQISEITVE